MLVRRCCSGARRNIAPSAVAVVLIPGSGAHLDDLGIGMLPLDLLDPLASALDKSLLKPAPPCQTMRRAGPSERGTVNAHGIDHGPDELDRDLTRRVRVEAAL